MVLYKTSLTVVRVYSKLEITTNYFCVRDWSAFSSEWLATRNGARLARNPEKPARPPIKKILKKINLGKISA